MLLYKITSALLEYPDQDLKSAIPEIAELMQSDEVISEEEHGILHKFMQWLDTQDVTELQASYVKTFDMTPEHSLHLTHHLFGDDRGRGPALIDLSEYYRGFGLEADAKELPDYLPLILEFASTLEEIEAKVFLGQTVKVLTQLAVNLETAESPYAPLVRMIEKRGQLVPLTEALISA
jgi:nitrate reductase molybdenum cofactor assembly chaperone NarJ/NarW